MGVAGGEEYDLLQARRSQAQPHNDAWIRARAEDDDILAEFHLPGVEALRREEMWPMVHDDNFHTALVTGCAGSGKTTVAVYRLVRLNNQGDKVRLLTFQNMLVVFIKNLVVNNSDQAVDIQRPVPLDRISTFHDWFHNQRRMRFNVDSPPPLATIRAAFEQRGFKPRMPVELLVDEGQDLPLWVYQVLPDYYARMVVGADPAQQVHDYPPDHVDQIKTCLEAPENAPFLPRPLGHNFRNTYETYCFARQFLPREEFEEVWHPNIVNRLLQRNRHGHKPTVISYANPQQRNDHMQRVLRDATGIVGILCPIGPATKERFSGESVGTTHKLLASWGISATPYHADLTVPAKLKRYIVTTFKSAKGLEFDTVVIPRMNFYRDPETDSKTTIREEMYVACTRAKSRLYVYRDLTIPQYDPIGSFDPTTYEGPDGQVTPEDNPAGTTRTL